MSTARIFGGEAIECLIERQEILITRIAHSNELVQVEAFPISAAFEPLLVARPVDEDAAHRLRRGGEKVTAAIPLRTLSRADEADICFVDQRRGLESLPRILQRHPLGRQPPKFVID